MEGKGNKYTVPPKSERKRGRPAGSGREPLTKKQKLERNAQYEKERREEFADALSELRAAAGLSENLSQNELLWAVEVFIKERLKDEEDARRIKKRNEKTEKKIRKLERKLGLAPGEEPPEAEPSLEDDED